MAARSGALTIGTRAIGATFRYIGVSLPFILAYALVLTGIDLAAYSYWIPTGQISSRQDELINVLLPLTGIVMLTELILGPLFAAFAIYVGRAASQGAPASLYRAVNFALTRYGRMFLPHLAAQLSIQFGMIIIIPGVLFQMQYAFVDAVAALEDEKNVLNRSKRLTRGRRRSIFFLFLPWLILSQIVLFIDLWAYKQSAITFFVVKAISLLIPFIMQVSYFLLYDERTRKRKARKQAAANTNPTNTDPTNTDPTNTDPTNTDPTNTDAVAAGDASSS